VVRKGRRAFDDTVARGFTFFAGWTEIADYGLHAAHWISRFTDAARQAAAYRERRVLLAGDAAHVHSPVGGQGLNTGLQDAVNLGWKLAQVVKGISPESLLNTYHTERHPVRARVLRQAMAGAALLRQDDQTNALRETLAELLVMDEPRKRLAANLSGLDIRYNLGEGHPLLGRRMPDLDLATTDGPRRVFSLLHEGRSVLLGLVDACGVFDEGAAWSGGVRCLHAQYESPWVLPGLGKVTPPTDVLIRPDGHVAWVGEGNVHGLANAMRTWCGSPGAV
jgi:3-(3-hydroxy-phenyl)propionate hydroxylase